MPQNYFSKLMTSMLPTSRPSWRKPTGFALLLTFGPPRKSNANTVSWFFKLKSYWPRVHNVAFLCLQELHGRDCTHHKQDYAWEGELCHSLHTVSRDTQLPSHWGDAGEMSKSGRDPQGQWQSCQHCDGQRFKFCQGNCIISLHYSISVLSDALSQQKCRV